MFEGVTMNAVAIKSFDINEPEDKYFLAAKLTLLFYKGISWRELQCLSLWLVGKTMVEIGKCLYISSRTVETHLTNVRMKLQIRSKQEVVNYFLQENLYDQFLAVAHVIITKTKYRRIRH